MSDPIYADARLAPVYDAFEGDRADLDPYLRLADELDARRIVDLGCGTGCLALALATPGRTITAIDPANASLAVARGKPGAAGITWIEGDATAIPPGLDADLVTMTGNAAQGVLTDRAWRATLRHVHTALIPGGAFVFETRRPERRAWLEWADPAPVTADVPGIGPVERRLELTAVELPYVSFRFTYRFLADHTTSTSDSTIRFRDRSEVEEDLRAAGFTVTEVRDAPDRPGREFVFIAEPAQD